jgi:hypothetical protein
VDQAVVAVILLEMHLRLQVQEPLDKVLLAAQ